MSKLSRTGSIEKFKQLLEQKIEDLSSCDKTNKQEITSSTDENDAYTARLQEATEGYANRGYDVEDETIKEMISDTADYLTMAPEDYTIDDWFEDTKMNYPETLDPDNYNSEAITSAEDTEDTEDSLPNVSKSEIVSWLSDHDQAWEDVLDYFGSVDLSEIDKDDIVDWMYEHDQLWEDFMNHMGLEEETAVIDDDYMFDFEDKLRNDIFGESPVVDEVDIDPDSNNNTLYITVDMVDDMGEVSTFEYSVPYSDLSGNPEDDSDYILSEIDADIMEFEE